MMFLEYISYAYHNLFRFPKRFITVVIGISLATFGILSLISVTTTLRHANSHIIYDLEHGYINKSQLYIQPQTLDQPITQKELAKIVSFNEVDKGYYFEEFSYYLWQYHFLLPWIEMDNKLNIELNPTLLDITSAKNYGLKDKIIAGRYFSDHPNEIIISKDILNRFLDKKDVLQDNYIILSENTRQNLQNINNEWMTLEDFIGKELLFTYQFQFELDKTDPTQVRYKISNPIAIPLKIVGIYNPSIGYQTTGNVWLPLAVKDKLQGLNLTSSTNQMGRQLSIHVSNVNQIETVKSKIGELGFFATPTIENDPFISSQLMQRHVQQIFFLAALIIAVVISMISFIVIITLMISDRKYEFYLQSALGASKHQILFFFACEIFFITIIGTLTGLFFTLLFLQSKIDIMLNFDFYLNGDQTLFIIFVIPILSVIFSIIALHRILNGQVSIGLAKEDA